jgi:hypothetical protein
MIAFLKPARCAKASCNRLGTTPTNRIQDRLRLLFGWRGGLSLG